MNLLQMNFSYVLFSRREFIIMYTRKRAKVTQKDKLSDGLTAIFVL